MNRGQKTLGILLILIGLSSILKSMRILQGNLLILFGSLFLLYLWYIYKENLFFILGTIGTIYGILSVLNKMGIYRFRLSGEILLLVLGILFIFLYYAKNIFFFVFPGSILISMAGYVFLMKNFNSDKLWPSYFILLGFAFYLIYFIAYYEKSSWALVVGTIFNIFGILFFGFSLGIINAVIFQYYKYLIPVALIVIGLLLLINVIAKKS